MPTAIAAFALNAAIVCLIALAGGAAAPAPGSALRRIDFTDLPAALHRRWVSPQEFTSYLDRVVGDTDRRVTEGEREHLIYFALQ
ncbi:MAG: hypothetical protein JF601_07635, partial [Acidobacteria bacterium]|nr:hypothetical protein [Acidobacteriota bacterium]